MFQRSFVCLMILTVALTGCAPEPEIAEPQASQPAIDGKKYLLDSEPEGAKSVTEVRKNAKDGDEVVVVGRIGDRAKEPWVEGRAAFVIADDSFVPCLKCEDPYCETDEDEFNAGRASVKVVDESGKTIAEDARKLLGVKRLDVVVIRGKVERTDDTFVIKATSLHVRPAAKK